MRNCKEWLNTKTFEYKQAACMFGHSEWIEIPEGAEIAIQFKNYPDEYGIVFYKNGGKSCMGKNDNNWQNDAMWTIQGLLNENYCEDGIDLSHDILWVRPTQPEALPFIDDNPQSLNDQYAEIEEVRQHKSSAWDTQVGGNHYKQFKIQPMQFALENKLDAAQQNIIKYIMRHSFKNGKQDLEKAKHYVDLMIEFYYGDGNNG